MTLIEICIFALLGTIMFISKVLMEFLPNIHLLGMFVMVYTLLFRTKALIPIYVYVFLNGIYAGFAIWWIPYLYIWTLLFFATMLLPKKMPKKFAAVVYPIVCGLHGLLFGTLYAPAQALFFGYNLKQTITWIIAGLPWDAVHAVGDVFAGMLVLPVSEILKKILKPMHITAE